jgi:nucleoside-diphosphate-sugar epimerase
MKGEHKLATTPLTSQVFSCSRQKRAPLSKRKDLTFFPRISAAVYYDNNVVGSINLVRAMAEMGCKNLVFSSVGRVNPTTLILARNKS